MKKYKNLIPIIVLALFCLSTIFQVLFIKEVDGDSVSSFEFSVSNYLAFVSVVACILIYFYLRRIYRRAVIVLLILGFFGILKFTVNIYEVNILFPIEPVSFMIGVLFLILNYKLVSKKFAIDNNLENDSPPNQEKILDFKEKYRWKEEQELLMLIENPKYIVEAKLAAKELLDERKESPAGNSGLPPASQ